MIVSYTEVYHTIIHTVSSLSTNIQADQVCNVLVIVSYTEVYHTIIHTVSSLSTNIQADQVCNVLVIVSYTEVYHTNITNSIKSWRKYYCWSWLSM